MIREEAIKMLKSKIDGHTDTSYEWAETVRMAIKALEQEPSGDCISREETLKALMDEWTEYDSELMDFLIEKVKKLPPVSSQQEMGYWEWVQYDGNPNIGNWHCSKCRSIISHMPEKADSTPIYKWCPMCGIKIQKRG